MRIAILAGGVGGSRFTRGVRAAYPDAELTVIVNTADDIVLHGLHVSPDLDTVMYALGGGIDVERGWGRAEETWQVGAELKAYGAEPSWFNLGDRDLATHVIRSQLLTAGYPLSDITAALCTRWLPAEDGPGSLTLRPMTDDRVETHVVIADTDAPGGRRAVHFQEYWVRLHAGPDAQSVHYVGIESARPGPGVIETITDAELILVAPSNPVVSIGPIVAVPGIRAAVQRASAPVIGFSGVLDGAPVLGMAHRLLPAIGVEVDAAAVGLHYGSRGPVGDATPGLLDAWVVDERDADGLDRLRAAGLRARATPLIMSDPEATATFVRHGVELADG
ncbi:MAG: 2-phospho-L-lactate transferase [Propionibacteriaceae bacterium]